MAWRLEQLEFRLAQVERVVAELQSNPRALATNGKSKDEESSEDEQTLVKAGSEIFGSAVFLPNGDEVRGGVTTVGPCYEVTHSIWDMCILVGLDVLSPYDSVIISILTVLNILMQLGFVYIVHEYMCEPILGHDQLQELIRFRTNIAHQVKYADMETGRSLARQVCGLDEQLPWASTQFSTVDNLQNYAQTGQWLALLAIGCWLATTLREIFNIAGFVAAVRGYEIGDETELEEKDQDTVKITQITRLRRTLLFIFVALPRTIVGVVLMHTGTRYLANTVALEDLILNAVALAFILDLDELIESAFAPRRARFMVDELKSLPIPRLHLPCYGRMSAGTQEMAKNAAKFLLLIFGTAMAWYVLLNPLQHRIELAISILCGGHKDFVYAENPATGIIETTRSFQDQPEITLNQKTVLRMAGPPLRVVEGWEVTQEELDRFYEGAPPALHRFLPGDDRPSMQMLKTIEQVAKSDTREMSLLLPCMDEAYPRHIVRPQLQELVGVDSCGDIVDSEVCSQQNMSALRALCPETCGCDNALDPACGAFATPSFGCPRFCLYNSLRMPRMQRAPCQDLTPEQLAKDPYVPKYLHGVFTYVFSKTELRKRQIQTYKEVLKAFFFHKLPGPNKTESIERSVEWLTSGGLARDIAKGKWNMGADMPHPRGLKGCAFFESWELKELTGWSVCSHLSELDEFRGLRAQCPLTCACRNGQVGCPGTCPEPIE